MKFDLKIIKLNNFRYFKLIVHIISLDFLEVKKKFYRFLLNFHDSPKLLINTMNYYMWNKIAKTIKNVSHYSFGKIHDLGNIHLKKSGTVAQQNAV